MKNFFLQHKKLHIWLLADMVLLALFALLRESRELAVLTARYYDRSYHKHEKYTL